MLNLNKVQASALHSKSGVSTNVPLWFIYPAVITASRSGPGSAHLSSHSVILLHAYLVRKR